MVGSGLRRVKRPLRRRGAYRLRILVGHVHALLHEGLLLVLLMLLMLLMRMVLLWLLLLLLMMRLLLEHPTMCRLELRRYRTGHHVIRSQLGLRSRGRRHGGSISRGIGSLVRH